MAKMSLEIVTPEGQTFSGDVDMVIIPGSEGELGIYPMHVPLMTRLLPGEVRILQDGKESQLVVGSGFAEITQTKVALLTDMAMDPDNIDEQAVNAAIARAEEDRSKEDITPDELAEIEAVILRARAQLQFRRKRRG